MKASLCKVGCSRNPLKLPVPQSRPPSPSCWGERQSRNFSPTNAATFGVGQGGGRHRMGSLWARYDLQCEGRRKEKEEGPSPNLKVKHAHLSGQMLYFTTSHILDMASQNNYKCVCIKKWRPFMQNKNKKLWKIQNLVGISRIMPSVLVHLNFFTFKTTI